MSLPPYEGGPLHAPRQRACDFCGKPAKEPGFYRCESCLERIGTFVARARIEALEEAAKAVCTYAGKCNSNRCPCRTVRALKEKKS